MEERVRGGGPVWPGRPRAAPAVARNRPDLLVLDLHLPPDGGIALLGRLRCARLRPHTLVFSESLPTGAVPGAPVLGIDGFVSKRLGSSEVVEEARCLLTGRREGATVVRGFDQPWDALAPLSERQRQILVRAARGLTNKEIGNALGITDGTVKVHLHTIYRKLGVGRRAELAQFVDGTAPGSIAV